MKKIIGFTPIILILAILIIIPVTVYLVTREEKPVEEGEAAVRIYGDYVQLSKQKLLSEVGISSSQYSPWVMHKSGWGTILIYYCKNTQIQGVSRDRVWRAEFDKNYKLLDNRVAIEGEMYKNDDLSCSPGVFIDSNGVWYMYYLAADRRTYKRIYIYHATSQSPGLVWTKRGQIQGIEQPFDSYIEGPSPIKREGMVDLYFSEKGKLVRITSSDRHTFSSKTVMNTSKDIETGRVRYFNGYYHVYGRSPKGLGYPSEQIYIAYSKNGVDFGGEKLLMQSSGSEWDGDRIWSPDILIEDNILKVFYAGNRGSYGWWGGNTAIGLRTFNFVCKPDCSGKGCGDGDGCGGKCTNCPSGYICNLDNNECLDTSRYPCLVADIHGREGKDSKVGGWDVAMILANWKRANFNSVADIYGPKSNSYEKDGKVDGYDLSKVLACWGEL